MAKIVQMDLIKTLSPRQLVYVNDVTESVLGESLLLGNLVQSTVIRPWMITRESWLPFLRFIPLPSLQKYIEVWKQLDMITSIRQVHAYMAQRWHRHGMIEPEFREDVMAWWREQIGHNSAIQKAIQAAPSWYAPSVDAAIATPFFTDLSLGWSAQHFVFYTMVDLITNETTEEMTPIDDPGIVYYMGTGTASSSIEDEVLRLATPEEWV